MRYLSTGMLSEGMELSQPIFHFGNLILSKGTNLTKHYISKFENLGVVGAYVTTTVDFKSDEYYEVVRKDLRNIAMKNIERAFVSSKVSTEALNSDLQEVIKNVQEIISELLKRESLVVNLISLKTYDDYTFSHSINVAILSLILGVELGLNKEALYELGYGAILHDLGKSTISNNLLNKSTKLTDEEFSHIKGHSRFGADILEKCSEIPENSKRVVLEHHERVDGNGYPDGKIGDELHLYSKIVAICDVYDALSSKRSYKDALLPSEAIEFLMGSSGHFDIELVKVFCKNIAVYPIGLLVELSDGSQGLVVNNHYGFMTRPDIKLLDGGVISLSERSNCNITIKKVQV